MKWTKDNMTLIMSVSGYNYDGLKAEGYQVFHPYRGKGLFSRIMREACFRCPFLPKKIWYTKKFVRQAVSYIVVWDTLITKEYLKWLRKLFPDAQINYWYNNLVGHATHLLPEQVPENIRIWTYDEEDAKKYGLHCITIHAYCKCYLRPLETPEYDVFFIGRDKGRAEQLLDLEKQMQELGLKTKFIIVKDGRLSRRKACYGKPLSYPEMIDYVVRSKSVLNITMPGQKGITLRDFESVFFGVKLITTNASIAETGFVKRGNVFILGVDDLSGLKSFIDSPVEPVDPDVLESNTNERFFSELTA